MRISDWISDVCSSDLREDQGSRLGERQELEADEEAVGAAHQKKPTPCMDPQMVGSQGGPAADREHNSGDHRQGQQVAQEHDLKRCVVGRQPLRHAIVRYKAKNAEAHGQDRRPGGPRLLRSEWRRVGKEYVSTCTSGWASDHTTKN